MKSRKVKECVVKTPAPLRPTHSVLEAGKKMRSLNAEKFPVADQGKLIGMIPDKLADRKAAGFGHDPKQISVRDNMSDEKVYCRSDQSVAEARRLMKKSGLTFLPVVDAQMKFLGIVSLETLNSKSRRRKSPKP